MSKITIELPDELEAGLRELAAKEGVDFETVVRIALARILAAPR